MAFPQLLFDFFCDQINRRVKIRFDVLGEQIGARQGDPHGTGELALWCFSFVTFENNADFGRVVIQMVELVYPANKMIFDGLRERHVVRRQDQIHSRIMPRPFSKSQPNWQECGYVNLISSD